MPDAAKPKRLTFAKKKTIDEATRVAADLAARGEGLCLVLQAASAEERALLVGQLGKARRLKPERLDRAAIAAGGMAETEKAVRALFRRAQAANHILFFDEADALFGRRSAVRDAHDRHARVGKTLLGALARYKGVAAVAIDTPLSHYPELAQVTELVVDFAPASGREEKASEEVYTRPGQPLRAPPPYRAASDAPWAAPLPNLHFLVLVGDLEIGFCEVSGLTSESEVVERREGDRREVQKTAGAVHYDTLVLRRALTRSKDLYLWRQAIIDGKDDRRPVQILQLPAPRAKPVNRWGFKDCWPCRWSGPEFDSQFGGLAFEEVELCYDRFEWL